MALLQKVGKTFEPAAVILRCVADVEKNSENSRFTLSIQWGASRPTLVWGGAHCERRVRTYNGGLGARPPSRV